MLVLGLAALIQHSPLLVDILRWGGAAFLLWYGAQALRRAWRPGLGAQILNRW